MYSETIRNLNEINTKSRDIIYNNNNTRLNQVKTLLQYIADDIHNRNRQATAFSLLKSILTRDIVLPEIPELLVSLNFCKVEFSANIIGYEYIMSEYALFSV